MADLSKTAAPDPFAPPGGPPTYPPPAPQQYGQPVYGGSAPAPYGQQYGQPVYGGSAPAQYGQQYGQPVDRRPGYGWPHEGGAGSGAPGPWVAHPGGAAAGHPSALLARAGRTLQVSSGLLWAVLVGWVMFLAGGLAYASASSRAAEGRSVTSAVDTGDTISGFGVVLCLTAGAAVWALTAVWTSEVSRACRLAGNGHSTKASMAWWGLFVPLAGLLLPLLAHREAAAYVQSAVRVGGPGVGRGPWWRAEPVPVLLSWWWGLWAVAALATTCGLGFGTTTVPDGGWFIAAGTCGAAASVCGAIALRRLAAATAACAAAS